MSPDEEFMKRMSRAYQGIEGEESIAFLGYYITLLEGIYDEYSDLNAKPLTLQVLRFGYPITFHEDRDGNVEHPPKLTTLEALEEFSMCNDSNGIYH